MISRDALAELLQPATKGGKYASKHEATLTCLLGCESLRKAEAELPPLYDHCLNTTVSELCLKHNFEIEKQPEYLERFDKKTRFVRYKLAENDREKALDFINLKRLARGANPLSEKDFLANDIK